MVNKRNDHKTIGHYTVEVMVRKFMAAQGYTFNKKERTTNDTRADDVFKKKDKPSLIFEYKPFPADQREVIGGIGQCIHYLASFPEGAKSYLVIHEQNFFKLETVFRYVPWLGLLIYRGNKITLQHKAGILQPKEISMRDLQ